MHNFKSIVELRNSLFYLHRLVMMKHYTLIFLYYFILLSTLHRVLSLKCRTGNQQSDDQFQKIMQVCRRRFTGFNREDNRDFNGNRDIHSQESSDSESDEDLFDNKFLTSGRIRFSKNDNMSGGNRYDYIELRNMTRQSSNPNRSYSSINMQMSNKSPYDNNGQTNYNWKNTRNNPMNSHSFGDSNNYWNRHNNYNNNNNNMNRNKNYNNNYNNNYYNNNKNENNREQACAIQCFFNELNMVDQRGFPERSAVIGLMTKNIQDPQLRDFIEESVVECYQHLNSDNRQEKCRFSQNLLTCLTDKGSERCEDWDD